jgi:putative salt-induced outer membrane protein YdiY
MHKRVLYVAVVIMVVACPQLFADQVTLKNGDRLTGSIVNSDGKILTLRSDFAGEVKIQWDAIQEITSSEPLYLTGKDGQVLVGKVSTTDGKFHVQTANSGEVSVAKDVVQSVRSKEQQTTYEAEIERLRHPKLTDFWGTAINTGMAIARGNTQTFTFDLSGKAVRTTEKDKISVNFLSLYSNNSVTGKSVLTADMIDGGTRYDLNINPKWFGFGELNLYHDQFQKLNLRVVPAGGLGYHAIKSKTTTFDLTVGGSLDKEFFTTGLDQTFGEVLLGEAFSHQFSKITTLTENLQFFPNMTDTGQFRYVFNLGINTKLTKILSWQISFVNLYLSNPPPGVKTTDGVLTTGLTFTFGKPL